MALESTQPLVKMSTRNISWGQRRPVREADLTAFMCRMSWKSGSLNLLELSGPHRACYGTPLPLPFTSFICRFQLPRDLRRESTAARLLRLWVRIPPGHGCLFWVLCIVRLRSLRRADHSSRGVLPNVMSRCVWSRNLVNEEALAHCALSRQKQTNKKLVSFRIIMFDLHVRVRLSYHRHNITQNAD